MSVEGKVQIKMRTSVGTLRSQGTYWVEPDRAAVLVDKLFATYLVEPEPVSIVDAVTTVAAEMRAGHRLAAAPEKAEEVQADGPKSDESKGAARAGRRKSDGNGGSDQAGRLDKQADGKQG